MFHGGSLNKHPIFSKILSIGYEFETHDFTKLNLHENGRSLINSDLVLRNVSEKIKRKSITTMKDNYLLVRIPLHENEKEYRVQREKEKKELEEADEDDEYQNAFLEEYLEEQLAKHENEQFKEYFNENRKKESSKTVQFQITNDMGDGEFSEMVAKDCKTFSLPKNKIYLFQTNRGKTFDLKFAESIAEDCESFSGVEYVITYYRPIQQSNIILDTFTDACSRILDHLGNLEKMYGTLLLNDETGKTTPVGKLIKKRALYHKPGSNLYYMDTYDWDEWKPDHVQSINRAIFIPQMTFRCLAMDAIDIMREIVSVSDHDNYKVGRTAKKDHKKEIDDISKLEHTVDDLISEYNKKAKHKISMDSTGKTLKTYVFFILYKIYLYLQNHIDILSSDDYYLKDFLTYAPRHTNYDFYAQIKEMFKKHYHVKDPAKIYRFFYQPALFKWMYEFEKYDENEFNEKGEYIYGDGLNMKLEKTDEHYGNPMYSLSSYFSFFENPSQESIFDNDWFLESRKDTVSTTFDIVKHTLLIENRYFKDEVGLWMRNNIDSRLHSSFMNVRAMNKLVYLTYASKKKLENMEENPKLKRMTKKCDPFMKRDTSFHCVPRRTMKRVVRPNS